MALIHLLAAPMVSIRDFRCNCIATTRLRITVVGATNDLVSVLRLAQQQLVVCIVNFLQARIHAKDQSMGSVALRSAAETRRFASALH